MLGRLFRGRSRQRTGPAGPNRSPYAPLFARPPDRAPAAAWDEREQLVERPVLRAEETPEPAGTTVGPIAEVEPADPAPAAVAATAGGGPVEPAPPYEPLAHEDWAVPTAEVGEATANGGDGMPPVPISAAEHAVIIDVMRVAPDVRYRAARSLDMLNGLEETHGVALEHAILERARSSGKLIPLLEAIAR